MTLSFYGTSTEKKYSKLVLRIVKCCFNKLNLSIISYNIILDIIIVYTTKTNCVNLKISFRNKKF